MAYTISNPQIGFTALTDIDSGIIPANNANTGSTTTIPKPPMARGMVITAVDPTYGGGEFILLAGAASTVVGSLVTYNSVTYVTTLAPITGANLASPVAVAMSANASSTTWGWYQIGGAAVIKKPAVKALPTNSIFLSTTAGRVRTSAYSGRQVLGAKTVNSTTVTTTTSTVTVMLDRPHLQGQVI